MVNYLTEEMGFTHRQKWLIDRVRECVEAISKLEELQEWARYIDAAEDLGKELLYAVTEWQKYYDDVHA